MNTSFAAYKAAVLFEEQLKNNYYEVDGKDYYIKYRHPHRHVDTIDHEWIYDGKRADRSTGWKSRKLKHQWQVHQS